MDYGRYLHDKYSLTKELNMDILKKRIKKTGTYSSPAHVKHNQASWELQEVWGACWRDEISQGKARELSADIIERHSLTRRFDKAVKVFDVIKKAALILLFAAFTVPFLMFKLLEKYIGSTIPAVTMAVMAVGIIVLLVALVVCFAVMSHYHKNLTKPQ